MTISVILKSILHNIGVLIVGFIFASVGYIIDSFFGLKHYTSYFSIIIGMSFLVIGFLIRFWATLYFYKNNINIIVLHPQKKLITSGPFRFSRNPLYLGGNVFVFLGASLTLGTFLGTVLADVDGFEFHRRVVSIG